MRRSNLTVLLLACAFGCSGKEEPQEHKVVVEFQKSDEATAIAKATKEDYDAAYEAHGKAYAELPKIPNVDHRMAAMKRLDEINREYEDRKASDGLPSAAKWFRQQVEGKSAQDFVAE